MFYVETYLSCYWSREVMLSGQLLVFRVNWKITHSEWQARSAQERDLGTCPSFSSGCLGNGLSRLAKETPFQFISNFDGYV